MICKKCGKELKEGAKFCSGCGSKVESLPVAENKDYCFNCMSKSEIENGVCSVCGKSATPVSATHHLNCGTILSNKFMVGKALGEGGFGITYIGRDLKLDMKVAIKEFFPNGYVNRSNVTTSEVTCSISADKKDFFTKGKERFLREARILAKFSGEPGVVSVRDYFEENNTAYIIMEYLEGKDLKTYIEDKKQIPAEKTIEILMPVMKSLIKVHKQELIHRDISPDNIRITPGGVKLLDFGAAREVSANANKSLSVMLKHGYAPEEQYRSKGEQGPWTDVYAICATMYKCITGITPDDATQRMFEDELKSPSELGVSIDRNIEKAIMKGMAVYKKDRYQNIEELIAALEIKDTTAEIVDRDKTVFVDMEENLENKTVVDNDRTVFAEVDEGELLRDVPKDHIEPKPVESAPVKKEKKEKKKKSKKPLLIVLGILAVLVVIGVIIAMSEDNSSNDSSSGSKKNESSVKDESSSNPQDNNVVNDVESTLSDVEFHSIGDFSNGTIYTNNISIFVTDDWGQETYDGETYFSVYDATGIYEASMIQIYESDEPIDLDSVEEAAVISDLEISFNERGTLGTHDTVATIYNDDLYTYTSFVFNCNNKGYMIIVGDSTGEYDDVYTVADMINFYCYC